MIWMDRLPGRVSLWLICSSLVLFTGCRMDQKSGGADLQPGGKGSMKKESFGQLANGTAVDIYTLTNTNGEIGRAHV